MRRLSSTRLPVNATVTATSTRRSSRVLPLVHMPALHSLHHQQPSNSTKFSRLPQRALLRTARVKDYKSLVVRSGTRRTMRSLVSRTEVWAKFSVLWKSYNPCCIPRQKVFRVETRPVHHLAAPQSPALQPEPVHHLSTLEPLAR